MLPSPNKEQKLEEALSYAARPGAIVVAAAGNQGTIGSSAITRHVWVIPVAACDLRGQPIGLSNLGASIGRRGLRAPGEAVTSLGTPGEPITSGGTSAAAPFVTGTVALLWSVFPAATATEIRRALTQTAGPALRRTIVPPLLNAWAAYQTCVGRLPDNRVQSVKEDDSMTDDTSQTTASGTKERQPYRVRLPGFVSDQDVGLGDWRRISSEAGASGAPGGALTRPSAKSGDNPSHYEGLFPISGPAAKVVSLASGLRTGDPPNATGGG